MRWKKAKIKDSDPIDSDPIDSDLVFDKIFSLDSMPDRCSEAPESQFVKYLVRHLLIGNYRVLFRVVDDTVRVLDFKGGRQNKPG